MYSVKGHKEIINSIDGVGGLGIGEGAPEIVTGSRDGELASLKVPLIFAKKILFTRFDWSLSPVCIDFTMKL